MSDEHDAEVEEQTPWRTKVIAGAVASLLMLVAAFGLLRISSPAIPPGQIPPAGHYSLTCGFCHTVSTRARPIGVTR